MALPSRSFLLPLMALVLAGMAGAAHAAAPLRLPSCSWDSPGHNPFMGDVVAAVDHYADIPAEVRERLKQRMTERRYDDLVSIRRDRIEGRHAYSPEIRDMHFGERSVCAQTSRNGWSEQTRERGLVYCDSGHCILVPTVCRNVSRIERLAPQRVAGEDPPAAPPGELVFDPPAAGPPAAPQSFEELAQPDVPQGGATTPAPSVASGVSGDAAPGTAWSTAPPTPHDPFGGREPMGGLPPVIQLPPPQVNVPPLPPVAAPVPEPATWALMAAGVVLAGWMARRQRRRPPN